MYCPKTPEGAARLLAHIASPGRPKSALLKLQNWGSINGLNMPINGARSKSQINYAMLGFLGDLQTSVKYGDAFDRALVRMAIENSHSGPAAYSRPIAPNAHPDRFLSGRTWRTKRPSIHIAAAFREVMYKRREGLAFISKGKNINSQLEVLRRIFLDDHSWIDPTIEASIGRLLKANHVNYPFPKMTYFPILIS